ncbi:MAG: glycerophosphodiester phosphodiesterase, partial [Gammaproteobacteria bacterium]|nr:glycerophosphodiester phosphodiesterase [Gemmatimonadota bacterium]NIU76513.1 glycerophosphodiester phosphodiesterase [Gammaproteobacteria bacterium]
MHLNVETKLSPLNPRLTPAPEIFAKRVVDTVTAAGAADRVTVQSFDWRTLRHVQSIAPGIATAYLTARQRWLDNIQAGQPGPSPWTAGLDV